MLIFGFISSIKVTSIALKTGHNGLYCFVCNIYLEDKFKTLNKKLNSIFQSLKVFRHKKGQRLYPSYPVQRLHLPKTLF